VNNRGLFIYFSIVLYIALNFQLPNGIFDANNLFKTGYTCIFSPTNRCSNAKYTAHIDILNYFKNITTKEESVLVISKNFPGDAVRYYSMRSIAYNQRETTGAIAYIDLRLAIKNDKYHQKYLSGLSQPGAGSLPINEKILPFCKYSPDYVVIDFDNLDDNYKDIPIVFSNRYYIVYHVKDFCLANYNS
jgi:hypothetical protein